MGRGADRGGKSCIQSVHRIQCGSVGVHQWSWSSTIGDLTQLVLVFVLAFRVVRDEAIDHCHVGAVFGNVRETTDVAVTDSHSIGGFHGSRMLLVLIHAEEGTLNLKESDVTLGDELTTKWVIRMHTIQHNEEVDLLHALLPRQLRRSNTADLVEQVVRPGDIIAIVLVNLLAVAEKAHPSPVVYT